MGRPKEHRPPQDRRHCRCCGIRLQSSHDVGIRIILLEHIRKTRPNSASSALRSASERLPASWRASAAEALPSIARQNFAYLACLAGSDLKGWCRPVLPSMSCSCPVMKLLPKLCKSCAFLESSTPFHNGPDAACAASCADASLPSGSHLDFDRGLLGAEPPVALSSAAAVASAVASGPAVPRLRRPRSSARCAGLTRRRSPWRSMNSRSCWCSALPDLASSSMPPAIRCMPRKPLGGVGASHRSKRSEEAADGEAPAASGPSFEASTNPDSSPSGTSRLLGRSRWPRAACDRPRPPSVSIMRPPRRTMSSTSSSSSARAGS
mmetsp:Transcript_164050/g.526048  ORF Transcript_164050/g.526048 Transcript_164050/m.526048 type:complete len:322 (-) Transcript_164050:657-1622(-)